ncbi:MAG: SelB C-terminal domain-containing protein [Filifactor alocis]|nr:SelB C-terminal domain-containing protein [Filifactor alocis]
MIGRRNEYIRTAAFEVSKDETYRTVEGKAEETLKKARFEFVKLSEVSFGSIGAGELEDIIATLMEEGVLVKVADDTFTLTSLMDEAKGYVLEKLAEENLITIAELRDLLGTNRKNAKQVMEYMDSIKVTKKVGGESERVGF